jgi:2,3-bisphosphoglycerate-dependent phosphoglycerate mutase
MYITKYSRLLLESGYDPDVIYTSRLKRAIKSAWVIMQEINAPYLPIYKSWRLNERHYGALQGLCKKETAKTFGADVVQAWRRSLKARPPPVKQTDDVNYPGNDRKFSDLLPEQIPRSESLLDCMRRTEPLWNNFIKRDLIKGENVMVVAHANTLRGLAKIIDGKFHGMILFLHV